MDDRHRDEAFLQLLRTNCSTPAGRGPAAGVDVPVSGWAVEGHAVTDTERADLVQLAADRGYITITDVAGYPFPTGMTAVGRKFVDDWTG